MFKILPLALVGVFFIIHWYTGATWALILSGIMALIVLSTRIKSGTERQGQAENIVLAKYTYQQLDDDTKNAVQTAAADILARGSSYDLEKAAQRIRNLEESKRYGLFALAMSELNISPAVPGHDAWNEVSNPMATSEDLIKDVQYHLHKMQKQHGIDLTIEESG